jgi:arylsulfatase A-like enzyme
MPRLPAAVGCALAMTLGGCEADAPPPPALPASIVERPNFLVIVPDSMRADRVNARRDGAPVAPAIDTLAERGAVFEQAVAQAGWTMPALATLLTGRYPVLPTADATMLGWMGPGPTFAEVLAIYDYDTYAFLGANAGQMERTVGSRFERIVGAPSEEEPRPGVGLELDAWLRSGPEEPWLAFVHDVDLQFVASLDELADQPELAQRCRHMTGNREDKSTLAIGELARCLRDGKDKGQPKEARQAGEGPGERVRAAYDQALGRYDRGIGRAMAALDETGLSERTVVILTSPHGHHLGENGRFQHGTLNEPDLRIPLLWVDPSAPQPGQRVPQLVQQIDLAPSILARAGATREASMVGQSLLPLLGLAQGDFLVQPAFHVNDQRNMALRDGAHKLIRFHPGSGGPRTGRRGETQVGYLLFDLEDDPLERNDLAKGDPSSVAPTLRERLDGFVAERLRESAEALPQATEGDDPALREHLRDHGYWHHVQEGAPTQPDEGAR